ncbi:MAG: right-handed parallel beta-helix repeat-containing protein [Verrucomicrobiota bacterium]
MKSIMHIKVALRTPTKKQLIHWLTMFILMISAARLEGAVYYVDSVTGDDSRSGTNENSAWKSLAKANQVTLAPGDKLLFKAGSRYSGQLRPKSSGSKDAPVIIDMYGTGQKPRIDGEGKCLETVLLQNVEYLQFRNIEITNTGAERANGRAGVRVKLSNFGTAHQIRLANLYVHDVNGKVDNGKGAGIDFVIADGAQKSRYDGLTIEDCHLVRTDFYGIHGASPYTRFEDRYLSPHVVIRGNLLEDIGGSGIVPIGCDGCRVEHNILKGARTRTQGYAAGIYPWGCDNTIVQFNEVSGVIGTKDAMAFDSDYYCRNSLFQYNYSHDNGGGFFLACSAGDDTSLEEAIKTNTGTVCRYNISQNDGTHSDDPWGGGMIIKLAGTIRNTRIYNNVIYVPKGKNVKLIGNLSLHVGFPDRTWFCNNIFYVDGRVDYSLNQPGDKSSNNVFLNNVFYGNHAWLPPDPQAIRSDPMLIKPGSGKDGINSLDGYKLRPGSPCIGAGTDFDVDPNIYINGGRDFWGNRLPADTKPNIGAYHN